VIALAAWLGAPAWAKGAEAVEPIRFARGASSAEVRGAVTRGERALYGLEARAGQRMSVRIAAPESNAAFQIYAPGARPEMREFGLEVAGRALPGVGEGDDAKRWTGMLPQSGAYLLVVGATRGNATYRLTIEVR
jgi:hypothetical protein